MVIESLHEVTDGGIELADGAVVVFFIGANVAVERAVNSSVVDGGFEVVGVGIVVEVRVFLGRVNGGVGFVGTNEDEVGFFGVGAIDDPIDGFIDDGFTIPFSYFADLFAIADPAVGVFGAVEGVDGGAEPVVEAMVAGMRLILKVAQMPFTDEAGVVAFFFQQGGEGDFVGL